eukprot:2457840-Pleurochrysis_carterae.AAC.2
MPEHWSCPRIYEDGTAVPVVEYRERRAEQEPKGGTRVRGHGLRGKATERWPEGGRDREMAWGREGQRDGRREGGTGRWAEGERQQQQ